MPSDPVAVAVALADKIDMLVGFWAIDEKPTGSKDPYALRRAALGVIRIVLDNRLRLPLNSILPNLFSQFRSQMPLRPSEGSSFGAPDTTGARQSLLDFFADRLKVHLRENGARHDLVDAVFALGGQDDLVLIVRRVEALAAFLDTDNGKNLLAGYKRATNILRIEEKKDKIAYTTAPDPALYQQAEEKELAAAIDVAKLGTELAFVREDFAAAMSAVAKLRLHVDAFFDKVTVNVDDVLLRANRLRLLNRDSRGHPHSRRFLQDRGLMAFVSVEHGPGNTNTVMPGLDPGIHRRLERVTMLHGSPGQARR